jgi:hypothetical protein
VLWENGTTGLWGGQVVSVSSDGNGDLSNAAVTDPFTNDATVLEGYGPATSSAGVDMFFTLPIYAAGGGIDQSAYYSSGHIQFDIELGPNLSSNTIQISYYNNNGGGCGPIVISSGLSTTTFTHVSIPFATAFGSCDGMAEVSGLTMIVGNQSGQSVAPGLEFYINDLQITPN